MKKIVSVLAFTTYLLSASPAFAAAVDLCDESSDFGKLCGLTSGNFGKVVGGFVTLLLSDQKKSTLDTDVGI